MLAELFLSRVRESVAAAFPDTGALDARLEAMVAEGRAAWPDLDLPAPAFVAHLADRLLDDPSELDKVQATDLYLACACCYQLPSAIAAIDRAIFADVRPALRKFESSGVPADEVLQSLREKMLIAPPDELPKIANYRGVGSLKGWVRTSAVRLALSHAQRAKKHVELANEWTADTGDDVELAVLRDRFREPFKRAFATAMQSLSPRERNLLRMTVIDGMTLSDLAKIHNVHRATAGKWIQQARDKLGELTKEELQASLGVQWGELDSIIELVRSRIDVSIRRLLTTKSGT